MSPEEDYDRLFQEPLSHAEHPEGALGEEPEFGTNAPGEDIGLPEDLEARIEATRAGVDETEAVELEEDLYD